MKTSSIILCILFSFHSVLSYGQIDSVKNQYEYEICAYQKSNEKPLVLKNVMVGIADTVIGFINGTVFNYEMQPIGFSVLYFVSLTDTIWYGVMADSLGERWQFLQIDIKELQNQLVILT